MSEVSNTPSVLYTKVLVEITFDHPEWQGDGRDEEIALEALGHEIDRFLPRTSWRITEVETFDGT